jgi:hypothetical protein
LNENISQIDLINKNFKMGSSLSVQDLLYVESNNQNDYNPFNIPSITLRSINEFDVAAAFNGCPPLHRWTGSDFGSLPIEKQAAYADGVVRGSYTQQWLIDDFNSMTEDDLNIIDLPAVGGLAFYHLKTGNSHALNLLQRWCAKNKFNFNYMR